MKKKRVILGSIALTVALIAIFAFKIIYNIYGIAPSFTGKKINSDKDKYAFACCAHTGNDMACGGSSYSYYFCVIDNDEAYVFFNISNTTADCGRTVEYNKKIKNGDWLRKKLKWCSWKYAFGVCADLASGADNSVVWVDGLNDRSFTEKQIEWQNRFNELAGKNYFSP